VHIIAFKYAHHIECAILYLTTVQISTGFDLSSMSLPEGHRGSA